MKPSVRKDAQSVIGGLHGFMNERYTEFYCFNLNKEETEIAYGMFLNCINDIHELGPWDYIYVKSANTFKKYTGLKTKLRKVFVEGYIKRPSHWEWVL